MLHIRARLLLPVVCIRRRCNRSRSKYPALLTARFLTVTLLSALCHMVLCTSMALHCHCQSVASRLIMLASVAAAPVEMPQQGMRRGQGRRAPSTAMATVITVTTAGPRLGATIALRPTLMSLALVVAVADSAILCGRCDR